MNRRLPTGRIAAMLAAALVLVACEKPPPESVQRGPRGTGMVQVYNPATLAAQAPKNVAPEPLPAASPEGPKAGQVYQNVKVLGHLSVAEFARTMTAMTNWVTPGQGCVACHNPANFADDSLYTKVVSRRMLLMTQKINEQWKPHVGNTGVTCFTCHRGQQVPAEVWFQPLQEPRANTFAGNRAGQNKPVETVGLSSLPFDPLTPFLLEDHNIRVAATTALPAGNKQSIKQTEWTYGLMMHMSKSLGVNCTQCHNTRSFSSWDGEASPPRLAAYHGIRMTRALNLEFLVPLTKDFPVNRLGPGGDVAKVNCATCHQGAHKPLYGAQMAKYHPELLTTTASTPLATPITADQLQLIAPMGQAGAAPAVAK
ncbi:photosynthetic reaction center cytochrome PufC [Pseudorhodoferax sp. Leaf267]|uniref:photosynthetic reaction center cytochrome PufC n=1 Tax=Pseudorhodoferax sp. Leaf267 TaxID=1736316 RepID=UPI0009EAC979|nr:photosynthetic reaction center cytochrome PufC [Pseudorhodoferax sp. Leaf267]